MTDDDSTMPERPAPDNSVLDERLLFAEDEYVRAYTLVMAPEDARRWGAGFRDIEPGKEGTVASPVVLPETVLDLLSLVSEDCAERVRWLMRLTPEAAAARREDVAARIGRLTERMRPPW